MLATSERPVFVELRPHRDAATGMSGSDLTAMLASSDIIVDLPRLDKHRVLEAVAQRISARHGLSGVDVYSPLQRREEIGSTGLGHGLALPHAGVSGLKRPMTSFVRLTRPVSFGAPDGLPVRDMLVLLMPQDAASRQLMLVARIAEMCCAAAFRQRLRACVDECQIRALLSHALRM